MIDLDPRFPRHATLWSMVQPHLLPGELAHDAYHIHRVYTWAIRLAPEANADSDLAGAAGLVHDLVPIPKNSPQRSEGGQQSAAASGPLLVEAGYRDEECRQIMDAVRTSSWSRGLSPNGALGVVLQDADRLDAIGAIGIARCFACAQAMSSADNPGRFYDPNDPIALEERALNDAKQAADHFRAKLLKLRDGMHLPTAQAEARTRHDVMLTFLNGLDSEVRA